MLGLRDRAGRDAAINTIRARLIGAQFELMQALEESGREHLGATLAVKLDRALTAVDGALKCDALSGK